MSEAHFVSRNSNSGSVWFGSSSANRLNVLVSCGRHTQWCMRGLLTLSWPKTVRSAGAALARAIGAKTPIYRLMFSEADAHEADSLSARSHLSRTTRDRSLRNYKNNNKVNYDLLKVDGKPRLKRVK
jgi:hypothetical protein